MQEKEDRRRFLKHAGTAVWATPLVLTMGANRVGAVGLSCLPTGFVCGSYDGELEDCASFGPVGCCKLPCAPVGFNDGDPCTCS